MDPTIWTNWTNWTGWREWMYCKPGWRHVQRCPVRGVVNATTKKDGTGYAGNDTTEAMPRRHRLYWLDNV
ncbi:MAG: hypothetical protein IJ879_02045 [Muribaculaceae bacterium]|nr:hypothetical protein [Muribaculaceae bacterium]